MSVSYRYRTSGRVGMAITEAVLARVVADLTTDGDRLRGAGQASRHAGDHPNSIYARQTGE